MPFARPTLAALVTRIRSDFRSRLEIEGSLVRRSMADVLSVVWAGAVHMLHGHLDWLSRQLFPDTAERESLLRQAGMYGISPTAATFASGNVSATGAGTIPAGAILQRADGVLYRAPNEITFSGNAIVSIEAVEAGSAGNFDAGETLTWQSPIAGVDATVTIGGAGITGGFDEEDTEGTRDRHLLRLREPPEGGADQDYEAWALAVSGVTRAWVFRHENGLGTVVVRFVLDDEPDIFPDAAKVQEVQDALEAQRPTTAEVTAAAPTPLNVDFTISVTPDTQSVRDAVEAELADLLRRDAEPGDGAGKGTILLSQMRTAIGTAAGVKDYTLTAPVADVVPAVGELAVLGTVTWA